MNTIMLQLLEKATELGATVTGLVSVGQLRQTPAHQGLHILDDAADSDVVLVHGLHHPPSRPEMDLFTGKGGTEGNRRLMKINGGLISWLQERYRIAARDLPYYVEHGGVYLKDAALLAGLGTVGASNLLMVPGYGPCVRFRALLIQEKLIPERLPPAKPVSYSPCDSCKQPCRNACPEDAFKGGRYDRDVCLRSMSRDGAGDLVMDASSLTRIGSVQFCRRCELACPEGQENLES